MHKNSFLTPKANMMQDLGYEEMEEDLTCPVCLELYADPLMMPCSHSVCKACLHAIMKSRAKSGKLDLECPACRENHQLTAEQVEKLPKNLALENIVFRYQEIRSCCLSKGGQLNLSNSSSPGLHQMSASPVDPHMQEQDAVFEELMEECHCGMCESSEKRQAEWYCQQCQVLYCQRCLDTYHPNRGSLSKHKIRKPTLRESVESMLHCPDHTAESASIFCDTCKVVACHLCVCQGQGSHCSHLILDLDTARTKLKESVQGAKSELSTLILSYSETGGVVDSQIQEIRNMEESARSNISSQYKCMLSDIAATLTLAKKKSLESVIELANQHSSHLIIRSQQVKALLSQCQTLDTACEELLSVDQARDKDASFDSTHETKHERSASNASFRSDRRSNASFSSMDGTAVDCDVLGEVNIIKHATKHVSSKSEFSARGGRTVQVEVQDQKQEKPQAEGNSVSSDKKASGHSSVKEEWMKKRSLSESKVHGITSTHDDKRRHSREEVLVKRLSAGQLTPASKSKGDDLKEKPLLTSNIQEKLEDLVQTRKSVADKKNSERKMSGEQEMKLKQTRCDNFLVKEVSSRRRSSTPIVESDENTADNSSEINVDNTRKDKTRPEDQLLLRADEVGPVLEQVAALVKDRGHFEGSKDTEDMEKSSSEDSSNILACVSEFHTSSLTLLSHVADQTPEDYPIITPSVRSVVSPALSSQGGAPRVQSRTLITWGFNSTTFTADPLEDCSQWSVNVNRNTSHIGDIKSGYLFGVGVSTRLLSSKEQVGMTPESHAIICVGGHLAVCHDSTHTSIMPLTDLPLSVMITVARSKAGLVMAYKVMLSGANNAVSGRRVIALRTHKHDQGAQSEDKSFEFKVHPVFTVSQRVKMQFPLTSDV